MLSELGIDPIGRERVVRLVALDLSERRVDGKIRLDVGAHRLLGVLAEDGDGEYLDALRWALDDWEDLPPGMTSEAARRRAADRCQGNPRP